MAVTVIQNSCVAGAMGGLLAGRFTGSITPADYANVALAARAIANEFIVENAVLAVPMADADNANIGTLVAAVAKACIEGGGYASVTAADYLAIAKQIAAASKQAVAQLI